MSDVVRAAVWIPPDGEAVEPVNKLMRKARAMFDGPIFKPHVTLLSGIETTWVDADRKLQKLARAMPPFAIELNRIDWRAEYFRALFVAARLSPALATAKARAHEAFEMNPPDAYEPHLSLAYGKFSDAAREAFASAGGIIDIRFSADRLQLVTAAKGIPTREWRLLAEYPLSG